MDCLNKLRNEPLDEFLTDTHAIVQYMALTESERDGNIVLQVILCHCAQQLNALGWYDVIYEIC